MSVPALNEESASRVPPRDVSQALYRLSEKHTCVLVGCVFWIYALTTRVAVRAAWLSYDPHLAVTPLDIYTVQNILIVPIVAAGHVLSYRIGMPARFRAGAILLQGVLAVAIGLLARFAFIVAAVWLYPQFLLWPSVVHDFYTSPQLALATELDYSAQYLLAMVLIAGVVGWKRYQHSTLSEAQLATQVERTRLLALRRQLEPHSLFNTLNAIASLMQDSPRLALEMLGKFSDILRARLHEERETCSVQEELRLASQYLELYRIRFSDRLTFEVRQGEGTADCQVPSMLLQPLVENAVLHGASSEAPHVHVALRTSLTDSDHLALTIENTAGPRSSIPNFASSPGIGLRNTWDRLETHYGSAFELTSDHPEPGQVRICMKLPAQRALGTR